MPTAIKTGFATHDCLPDPSGQTDCSVGNRLQPISVSTGADLSDEEIDHICEGLSQNAAKVRYLRSLGLRVDRKPNGRPLVNRAHYNLVRSSLNLEGTGTCAGDEGPVWGVH